MTPGLLAGFASVLVVIVATFLVGNTTVENVYTASDAVARAHQVNTSLERLLLAAVDAETGERGFIITGIDGYLEPYTRGRTEIASALARTRELTAANRDHQADMDRLAALAEVKLEELDEAVAQRRQSGFAAAQAVVATNLGKRTMDEMRAVVARMQTREDRSLVVRTEQAQRSYQVARLARLTTAGLALFVLTALFVVSYRHGVDRERAAQTADRLAVTLASIGDAVIATDDTGCVRHMNPIAERLTGWTETQAARKRRWICRSSSGRSNGTCSRGDVQREEARPTHLRSSGATVRSGLIGAPGRTRKSVPLAPRLFSAERSRA